jgi:hypothetical protein
VLIERGSFRPVTRLTLAMVDRALEQMRETPELAGEPVVLMEMTLRNLLSLDVPMEHGDFLARMATLQALGKTVMISNYSRFHNVISYLRRYTRRHIVMALGVPTLAQIFEEGYYKDLEGGVLEAMGRLLSRPVTLFVYPWMNARGGEIVTAESFKAPRELAHLYRYLLENGLIQPIRRYSDADLSVLPADVLARLQSGDPSWQSLVPDTVARVIREQKLFGYREPA